MRLTLSIRQIGLVLVSVPVALFLIFILTLWYLLKESEQEIVQQENARTVVFEANLLGSRLASAAGYLASYSATRGHIYAEQLSLEAERVRDGATALKVLSSDSEQAREKAGQIELIASDLLKMLFECKDAVDSGGSTTLKVLPLRQNIESSLRELIKEVSALKQLKEDLIRTAPGRQEKLKAIFQGFLLLGLAASIVLAFAMAMLFSRAIKNRLLVLRDNSLRLAASRSLNPPLLGADEIADVDRSFHVMAKQLAEASRKERAMIENAVDVICSIDAEGKVLKINAACLGSWGYTPQILIGTAVESLICDADKRKFQEKLGYARSEGKSVAFEAAVKHKQGHLVDVLWSVYWSQEDQAHFCVLHDITERRNLERLKQDFINMVSHDLRSPLTTVQGFLDMLSCRMLGELNPKGVRHLTLVSRAVERLMRLVNDLLCLEKMESGTMPMSFQTVDVMRVLQQSADSLEASAQRSGISLKVVSTNCVVLADPDRLIQTIVNLLGNALKFSPANSTITLEAEPIQDMVEIRVIDQGRGIPQEAQATIFEKFKQVKGTDASLHGGTGLGLSICKAIVEQHGGIIGVRSVENQGSTFWFRIPAAVDSQQLHAVVHSGSDQGE